MKCKIFISFFALVLTLSLGSFEQVLACSCYQQKPVCEAFGNAKAIFVGEIVEGKSVKTMSERLAVNSRYLPFVFKVKQNFLGTEEEKNITIHTGFGGGDCGFPFEKGESYLVYAYENNGILQTGICSRTRHISRVEDDFEELKYLLLNNGARLSGTVKQYAKSRAEENYEQPMNKLKLQIEQIDGEKKRFEVLTDENGKYKLTDLPTGKYKVIPSLISGLMVEDYTMSEFLLNDKGCAVKDFLVKNKSSVTGKVVDEKGNIVNGVSVDLISIDLIAKRKVGESEHTSMIAGKFTIFNVPAGKYFLAANYTRLPSESVPFPTTFYGDSGDILKATVIEVKLGESIEGLTIKLPSPLPMKEIRGRVFWKNGKPAESVSINLRDFEAKQNISNAETDNQGNFTVKGFAGRKYILETYYSESGFIEFEAKDVEFVLNEKTDIFKLVLEKKVEEQ